MNYAKKATGLALDYLKNAMKSGKDGDELLNKLGWSRTEAEQFIKRQEQRLQNAEKPNANDDAKREAEDALRSLGLRPSRTARSQRRGHERQFPRPLHRPPHRPAAGISGAVSGVSAGHQPREWAMILRLLFRYSPVSLPIGSFSRQNANGRMHNSY